MNILKHMSPKAFKAMSAAGKAVTVLSAAGIVAGAGLLLISLNEGSVRSSADSQEIVARQKADASINAALGTEIGARLAGDAAATRASSDYTNDGIAKEALARQSALSLETAARQKVIADESGARQQAVAAESATARQYTDSAVATEAAARQQSIPAALATANSFTTTALTKETAD
ncbi:MAG: hypothetical protein EXR49_09640, partial [Dehalococcoidia bacterium]|nr:hypothetical protein [Dehalococcoidia bacterium]